MTRPVSPGPPRTSGSSPARAHEVLREVLETLAPLVRPPCSPGEHAAAVWIAERLERAGCRSVRLEDEPAWGAFPPTLGGVLAAGSLLGLADEIQNGPRVLRRLVRRRKQTVNVVAEAGDEAARTTLVVLAHHDAAQTGIVFDQRWAQALHRRWPRVMQRGKQQLPQWWFGVLPALLTLYAAVTGRRRAARAAVGVGAVATGAIADILRSSTVPGANDNLSGVAVLVALAESLRSTPLRGIRVLLVSCGAEESFQEGIRGFVRRHREELRGAPAFFLNLDTVGSTHLVMLEGEGPIWMEDYSDPAFRDLVARSAAGAGVDIERGVRARASTDAIIPSRAGFPTATLVSVMPWRLPGNYHLMSDVPANVDFGSLADCVLVARGVAEELAKEG